MRPSEHTLIGKSGNSDRVTDRTAVTVGDARRITAADGEAATSGIPGTRAAHHGPPAVREAADRASA